VYYIIYEDKHCITQRVIAIKLTIGVPEVNTSRDTGLINDRWIPLREPKNIMATLLLSIPIMAVCALITLAIASIFVPLSAAYFGIGTDQISITISLPFIAGIVILLAAHEFVHLLMIPGFARSDKTYIGLTYLGGFVYTEEIISKPRHIAVSVMPFLAISILLPVILGIAGLLNPGIILLTVLNSLGSSVDIFGLMLALTQVPAGARLTYNGMVTYWKIDSLS
jgi:hypothetical protein